MPVSASGHCLCGAVTFEYMGTPREFSHCHCESCRRATSAPFTTFFTVDRENLRFTGKQPATFESSPGVTRLFCKDCGSPMGYMSSNNHGEIDLYVASLSDHADAQPLWHSFWNERVPWLTISDDLPKKDD